MPDRSLDRRIRRRNYSPALVALGLALSVGMLTAPSATADDAYAVDTSKNFIEIDPLTGVTTPISVFSDVVFGIAFGQDRNLYGIDLISDSLVRIDLATGETISIGSLGINPSSPDLAFDDDGDLWMISNTQLYQVDTSTGAATLIGATGVANFRSLAWDGADLFGIGISTDDLYSINRTTGAATLIGPLINVLPTTVSLSSNSLGELIGVDWGSPSELFSIDKTSGEATLITTTANKIHSFAIDGFLDTDQDGLPDFWEILYSLDENNPSDAALDGDTDGLTNLEEYDTVTDPTNSDTDGDGLSDGDEVNVYGTDPLDPDTDGDSLSDGDEINLHSTDPLNTDTDGDLMPDDWEIGFGLDPLLDDSADDGDGDTWTNYEEYQWGTDPTDAASKATHREAYAIHSFGRLDKIDLLTGASTVLTSVLNQCHGLAFGQDRKLYTVNRSERRLYRIDPATLDYTAVDFITPYNDAGLAFDEEGVMWMAASSALYQVDPTTAETTLIGSLGTTGIDSLVWDGSQLFGLNVTSNDNRFYSINRITGAATLIADLDGLPVALYSGLTSDRRGELIGVGYNNGGPSQIYRLDKSSGETTNLSTTLTRIHSFAIESWLDDDDDGLPNYWEIRFGLDENDPSDNGLDGDGDGLTNLEEYDTVTDPSNADTDGDGLSDGDEVNVHGTDPLDPDSDDDDLSDGDEINLHGSDPLNPDTDGDLMPDGWEVGFGLDPLFDDSADDLDGDGLTNLGEYNEVTDPTNQDTDADGVSDGDEVNVYGSDPLDTDTDGDGLTDGDEVNVHGTSPTNTDTDGDLMPDDWEISNGLDPLSNDAGDDPDGDSWTNYEEYQWGTDPFDAASRAAAREAHAIYYQGSDQRLYSIDLLSGASSYINDLPDFYRGLAFGQDRKLYSINDTFDELHTIDPKTGLTSVIGSLGVTASESGLAFDEDGVLWMTSLTQFYRVDTTTGAATLIGTSLPAGKTPGVAWDGATLFGLNTPSDDFYSIDRTTGLATLIGPFSVPGTSVKGMTSDSRGVLIGVSQQQCCGGSPIFRIDKSTGEATTMSQNLSNLISIAIENSFPDTDRDGMPDYWEELYGFDLNDPLDAVLDPDGDGLNNVEEYDANADPTDTDSDGDGLTDGDEVNTHGTEADDPDTDGDGLSDGDEVNLAGSDPLAPDTDGDLMTDGWEFGFGLDPLFDDSGGDLDLDTWTNLAEFVRETDPTDFDSKPLVREAHTFDQNRDLYTIDLVTGAPTLVGSAGIGSGTYKGLAFGDDGNLYTVRVGSGTPPFDCHLIRIDPATGTPTLIGSLGALPNCGGDLAFDEDGVLWMVAEIHLFTIDTTTGAATFVGFPGFDFLSSLAWDGSELYGLDKETDSLYSIDRISGSASFVGYSGLGLSNFIQVGLTTDLRGNVIGGRSNRIFKVHKSSQPATTLATVSTSAICCIKTLAIDGFTDTDEDGLTDLEEINTGTDPRSSDTDEDGLTDPEEIDIGTDPTNPDTDGDGHSDGDEVLIDGTDPLDPASYEGAPFVPALSPLGIAMLVALLCGSGPWMARRLNRRRAGLD